MFEDHTEGLYESAISIRCTDVRYNDDKVTEQSQAEIDLITINDAKFNVLHICLVLETVGMLAETIKLDFRSFVLKSLSRVLEKAGKFFF